MHYAQLVYVSVLPVCFGNRAGAPAWVDDASPRDVPYHHFHDQSTAFIVGPDERVWVPGAPRLAVVIYVDCFGVLACRAMPQDWEILQSGILTPNPNLRCSYSETIASKASNNKPVCLTLRALVGTMKVASQAQGI
ncbi:hypothetical protein OPQ81_006948 [Rhizoctonia solani]|nr:hypothetical protein OPQ81_006948 [Rhizoctonia solani]